MTIYEKSGDEKLQYNINRVAVKITASSLGKIGKYEYFTGEEILPFDQSRMIKAAKFTCYPLQKAFRNKQKQLKIKEENKLNLMNNIKNQNPLTTYLKKSYKTMKFKQN